MLNEKRTGPISSADGSINAARSEKTGAAVIAIAHGEHNEAVIRDNVLMSASQAADTTSVALGAAYLGVCISNPIGSGHNLSILKAGWVHSVAPAAIATVHLAGGWASTGITAHTNAITIYNMKIGSPATSVANADDSATLVGTPIYILPLIGGFTLGTLFAAPMATPDIGGIIMVPPGAYVCIVTLTACNGFGCIVWEEIPI